MNEKGVKSISADIRNRHMPGYLAILLYYFIYEETTIIWDSTTWYFKRTKKYVRNYIHTTLSQIALNNIRG